MLTAKGSLCLFSVWEKSCFFPQMIFVNSFKKLENVSITFFTYLLVVIFIFFHYHSLIFFGYDMLGCWAFEPSNPYCIGPKYGDSTKKNAVWCFDPKRKTKSTNYFQLINFCKGLLIYDDERYPPKYFVT